jgi:release factor glutamine methyltransferase
VVDRDVAVARLAAAGCVAPEEEAAELSRCGPDGAVPDAWVDRRVDGEPLAWITGRCRFGGLDLVIDPGVYVPRPQTEELVRRAAALLPSGGRLLDVCTGSGAVAAGVAAVVPDASVVGVDVDPAAVACAARNGVPGAVAEVAAVPVASGCVDVVTAVAPYVPTGEMAFLPVDVQRHEPRLALDGGDDGLALVRDVVRCAGRVLRPGGWVVLEVGGAQDRLLAGDLRADGFEPATPWHDEDGDLRGVAARRS